MRTYVLSEINYAFTKENPFQVAVLPLGATEPHNLHLPYGTDTFEATIIGEHVCEAAVKRGAKVVLLPTVPYGTETNMRRFPLALNVNPSTLHRVISDLIQSLVDSGIRKILLLNSHGGNELKPLLRELVPKTDAHVFLCDWFKMVSDVYDTIFDRRDDHAGEMETSLALAYFPNLVARTPDGSLIADEGTKATTRFTAVNNGWVSITRPWHLLTTNTGAGNPHKATADKGEQLMRVLVERLASFLAELSAAELDEQFPF